MPPSLNLPDRVADLTGTRTGNEVALAWTDAQEEHREAVAEGQYRRARMPPAGRGSLRHRGRRIAIGSGGAGTFAETLPPALAVGPPRALRYYVELKNRNGRSAGLSNAAVILAGEAPAPVTRLTAEVRKDGVVLRWAGGSAQETLRLLRKLLTPPETRPKQGLLDPQSEPLEQSLLVESPAHAGRALDREIRFGQTYEYRAQRVARITADGLTLELGGELSAPVRVVVQDVFPPAVPAGLAAVATFEESGSETAIDLSWQPNTDADLAGYAVYRREGEAAWKRISPAQPLVGPAFHDAQVKPGHAYQYAVTAIDQNGHESARSLAAEEAVPAP